MIGTMGSVAGADAVAGGAAGRGAGGVVSRPRLVGRLAAQARVSVVSASPGSGKTVLLRSWISQPGVAGRAAWVPAGRGERDPPRFWLAVLAALRQTGPPRARRRTAPVAIAGISILAAAVAITLLANSPSHQTGRHPGHPSAQPPSYKLAATLTSPNHPGPNSIQSVYSVAFSPDGKTLATGSGEGTYLWDVR